MALAALMPLAIYREVPAHLFRPEPPEIQAPPAPAAMQSPVRAAVAPHSSRPVYPYSVIPGGAYNRGELSAALQSDPVAAQHYAGYFRAGVHPVVLSDSQRRYVSFRKNQRIYWTRRPVVLPKGETLLTDGDHYARARCGNQVSETPQTPVLAEDPPATDWEKAVEDPSEDPGATVADLAPLHQFLTVADVFPAPDLVAFAAGGQGPALSPVSISANPNPP